MHAVSSSLAHRQHLTLGFKSGTTIAAEQIRMQISERYAMKHRQRKGNLVAMDNTKTRVLKVREKESEEDNVHAYQRTFDFS